MITNLITLWSSIKHSNDRFSASNKNLATLIKEISIKLSSINDSTQLIKVARQELKNALNSKNIEIILNKDSKEDSFKRELLEIKQILIQNEISEENKDVKDKLKKNNIEMLIPLKSKKDNLGMIILDRKKDQSVYTKEEIEFVEIVVHQLVMQLQKVELINQVNETKRRFSALRWEEK